MTEISVCGPDYAIFGVGKVSSPLGKPSNVDEAYSRIVKRLRDGQIRAKPRLRWLRSLFKNLLRDRVRLGIERTYRKPAIAKCGEKLYRYPSHHTLHPPILPSPIESEFRSLGKPLPSHHLGPLVSGAKDGRDMTDSLVCVIAARMRVSVQAAITMKD